MIRVQAWQCHGTWQCTSMRTNAVKDTRVLYTTLVYAVVEHAKRSVCPYKTYALPHHKWMISFYCPFFASRTLLVYTLHCVIINTMCGGSRNSRGSESYARMRLGDTVSWVFLWGSHQHSWYMRRCMTPRRSITALRVDSHAMACMRPCACTEFAVDTPGRLKHWLNFHYWLYIYTVVLVWDPITCYTICNTFNVFISTTARAVGLWVSNVSFSHIACTCDCDRFRLWHWHKWGFTAVGEQWNKSFNVATQSLTITDNQATTLLKLCTLVPWARFQRRVNIANNIGCKGFYQFTIIYLCHYMILKAWHPLQSSRTWVSQVIHDYNIEVQLASRHHIQNDNGDCCKHILWHANWLQSALTTCKSSGDRTQWNTITRQP